MNRIENLVDLDKLNELKVSELKKLNKLLGKMTSKMKQMTWKRMMTTSSRMKERTNP